MPRRSCKKIKDLVDMLEDLENITYVGGDYEDVMEMLENEMSPDEEDQQTLEEEV